MGMDVSGLKPTNKAGEYFRANIWSWRPIHALCETVLKQRLPDWGYNDGDGFKSQLECSNLADKLEDYLTKNPKEQIALESDMRVDPVTGSFLKRGSQDGESAYTTSQEHVKEFITFLRNCGGFEIY